MMTHRFLFSMALLAAAVLVLVQTADSRSTFAPAGNTGAPGDQTCATAGCHSGGVVEALNTNVTLTANGIALDASFRYRPDSVYAMMLEIDQPSARGGFSLLTLDDANAMAGAPSNTDGNSEVTTVGSKQYVGHTNTLGVSSWAWDWTAPNAGTGDVSFYASVLVANNNGNNAGDTLHPQEVKIEEDTTGSTTPVGIARRPAELPLTVLGTVVRDESVRVSFQAETPGVYTIEVIDPTGRVIGRPVRDFFHGGTKTLDLPLASASPGVHHLYFHADHGRTIRKFVVTR